MTVVSINMVDSEGINKTFDVLNEAFPEGTNQQCQNILYCAIVGLCYNGVSRESIYEMIDINLKDAEQLILEIIKGETTNG